MGVEKVCICRHHRITHSRGRACARCFCARFRSEAAPAKTRGNRALREKFMRCTCELYGYCDVCRLEEEQ